jgi:hypothetical protein
MNKFKVNFIQCYNKKRMPISHWIKFIINETLSLTALNFESKSQDPKSTSELGGPVDPIRFLPWPTSRLSNDLK